ncbi:ArnT family glycosyltransferase [Roseateles chitinivorans]|uniref:ArnT family glycosyltransferase n=1 Tax=Roseateles chitinivorans TaxID=2917965 RepID=UPI003D678EAD
MSRALDVREVAHTPPRAISTTFWVVVLLALCIGLRTLTLGTYPLSDNTEARYAEIARIMMSGGDWINLHLPGDVVFWGKPPLSTWFSATGQLALGANEWGARLPMLVLAMMVTLIVWRWLRDSSAREAILGVAVLWGSAVFFVSAGAVMTDMALTVAVTLSIGGFWWAISGTNLTRVRVGALAFFVGLALGLLAKGPVALVLSLVPVAVHGLSCRGAFRDVIVLPWFKGDCWS